MNVHASDPPPAKKRKVNKAAHENASDVLGRLRGYLEALEEEKETQRLH